MEKMKKSLTAILAFSIGFAVALLIFAPFINFHDVKRHSTDSIMAPDQDTVMHFTNPPPYDYNHSNLNVALYAAQSITIYVNSTNEWSFSYGKNSIILKK